MEFQTPGVVRGRPAAGPLHALGSGCRCASPAYSVVDGESVHEMFSQSAEADAHGEIWGDMARYGEIWRDVGV